MTEQNQTNEETPRIVVSDVVNCLQIVDTAISRGAYRGSEIAYVGKIRDAFANYVEYQKKLQEQEEGVESEEEPARITVGDIAGGLQLIDAAIERGAFKGEEVSAVGKVRGVFSDFVEEQKRLHEEMEESQEESQ